MVRLLNDNQGQWTKAEQDLLSYVHLSEVGFAHHLDTCVVLNAGTPSVTAKIMATTVEAVLGAVYLDGGEDALGRVLETLNVTHEFLKAVTFTPSPPLFMKECYTPLYANRVLRPRREEGKGRRRGRLRGPWRGGLPAGVSRWSPESGQNPHGVTTWVNRRAPPGGRPLSRGALRRPRGRPSSPSRHGPMRLLQRGFL